MATELRKRVKRKTIYRDRRGRALVITLQPGDTIELREERCRKVFTISIPLVYSMAVKLTVDRERAEKKAKRKARGRG